MQPSTKSANALSKTSSCNVVSVSDGSCCETMPVKQNCDEEREDIIVSKTNMSAKPMQLNKIPTIVSRERATTSTITTSEIITTKVSIPNASASQTVLDNWRNVFIGFNNESQLWNPNMAGQPIWQNPSYYPQPVPPPPVLPEPSSSFYMYYPQTSWSGAPLVEHQPPTPSFQASPYFMPNSLATQETNLIPPPPPPPPMMLPPAPPPIPHTCLNITSQNCSAPTTLNFDVQNEIIENTNNNYIDSLQQADEFIAKCKISDKNKHDQKIIVESKDDNIFKINENIISTLSPCSLPFAHSLKEVISTPNSTKSDHINNKVLTETNKNKISINLLYKPSSIKNCSQKQVALEKTSTLNKTTLSTKNSKDIVDTNLLKTKPKCRKDSDSSSSSKSTHLKSCNPQNNNKKFKIKCNDGTIRYANIENEPLYKEKDLIRKNKTRKITTHENLAHSNSALNLSNKKHRATKVVKRRKTSPKPKSKTAFMAKKMKLKEDSKIACLDKEKQLKIKLLQNKIQEILLLQEQCELRKSLKKEHSSKELPQVSKRPISPIRYCSENDNKIDLKNNKINLKSVVQVPNNLRCKKPFGDISHKKKYYIVKKNEFDNTNYDSYSRFSNIRYINRRPIKRENNLRIEIEENSDNVLNQKKRRVMLKDNKTNDVLEKTKTTPSEINLNINNSTDKTSSEQRDNNNPCSAEDFATDVSFLDDFDIDEIVECLKDSKEPDDLNLTSQINEIDNNPTNENMCEKRMPENSKNSNFSNEETLKTFVSDSHNSSLDLKTTATTTSDDAVNIKLEVEQELQKYFENDLSNLEDVVEVSSPDENMFDSVAYLQNIFMGNESSLETYCNSEKASSEITNTHDLSNVLSNVGEPEIKKIPLKRKDVILEENLSNTRRHKENVEPKIISINETVNEISESVNNHEGQNKFKYSPIKTHRSKNSKQEEDSNKTSLNIFSDLASGNDQHAILLVDELKNIHDKIIYKDVIDKAHTHVHEDAKEQRTDYQLDEVKPKSSNEIKDSNTIKLDTVYEGSNIKVTTMPQRYQCDKNATMTREKMLDEKHDEKRQRNCVDREDIKKDTSPVKINNKPSNRLNTGGSVMQKSTTGEKEIKKQITKNNNQVEETKTKNDPFVLHNEVKIHQNNSEASENKSLNQNSKSGTLENPKYTISTPIKNESITLDIKNGVPSDKEHKAANSKPTNKNIRCQLLENNEAKKTHKMAVHRKTDNAGASQISEKRKHPTKSINNKETEHITKKHEETTTVESVNITSENNSIKDKTKSINNKETEHITKKHEETTTVDSVNITSENNSIKDKLYAKLTADGTSKNKSESRMKSKSEIKHMSLEATTKICKVLSKDFVISSFIHKGQFSEIFQCKDKLGKMLVAKISSKGESVLDVKKEDALLNMHHDILAENIHTLVIHKYFSIDYKWCYLMDYYPKNLEQALRESNKTFSIDVLLSLSRQLVTAVLLLRNNNIVHSDIKPSHILLDNSNSSLKLGGFDEAYMIENAKIGSAIGSVKYRAPEVILGHSAGFSIDVWSTAVVLYEMATRKTLMRGTTNNEVLYEQMNLFGAIPSRMLQQSLYKDAHFKDNLFIRRGLVKKTSLYKFSYEPITESNMRGQVRRQVLDSFNRDWGVGMVESKRRVDADKCSRLCFLLADMLQVDPDARNTIEFVVADPLLYK